MASTSSLVNRGVTARAAAEPSPATVSPEEEARFAELQSMALDFARQGDAEALESMIGAGFPPNTCDHKGNSLLMLAAYHGHAPVVRLMIAAGADPNTRNDRGQSALAGVAFKGHAEVASVLLAAGADVDGGADDGRTPAAYAALFGNTEVLALLGEAGAFQGDRRTRRVLGFRPETLARWVKRLRSALRLTGPRAPRSRGSFFG